MLCERVVGVFLCEKKKCVCVELIECGRNTKEGRIYLRCSDGE